MFECVVKKVILKKLNKLLKEYDGNIDKAKETIRLWLKRVNLISSCLEKLIAKLDDGSLTAEEVTDVIEDVQQLIKDL